MTRQRFGVRQSSAALDWEMQAMESGTGVPHSKTLAR